MRGRHFANAFVAVFLTHSVAFSASVLYEQKFDTDQDPLNSTNNSYNSDGYASADARLGSEWKFRSTTYSSDTSSTVASSEGRIQIYNWGGSRGGVLLLDDGVSNSKFSLNEAVLTVNLLGKTDITLAFDHYDSYDEEHAMGTTPFTAASLSTPNPTNPKRADGVAISDDGINWFPLINFKNGTSSFVTYSTNDGASFLPQNNFSQSDNTWVRYAANLSGFIGANSSLGLSLASQFFIKFQQWDDDPHGTDGRKFDNLIIMANTPSSGGQSAVPEPATATLFGIGLLGLAYGSRRRRKAA